MGADPGRPSRDAGPLGLGIPNPPDLLFLRKPFFAYAQKGSHMYFHMDPDANPHEIPYPAYEVAPPLKGGIEAACRIVCDP